jgi:hypothetical protein
MSKPPNLSVERDRRQATLACKSTQLPAGGINGGLHPRSQLQLAQNVLDVNLDRGFGNVELVGNRLVVVTLGNQRQHFALANRKQVQPRAEWTSAPPPAGWR